MKSNNRKSFNKRAFVSLALFAMFILLPISGKMIVIMQDNHESMLVWCGIHCLFGLLFAGFGIFHIVYNWKALKLYLKSK